MKLPLCTVHGCKCHAFWALIPGFDSGLGRYLCRAHWQQILQQSNVQAECYAPLPT